MKLRFQVARERTPGGKFFNSGSLLAPAIAQFDKGAYFRENAGNLWKGIFAFSYFLIRGTKRFPWGAAIVLF
jgi:hypothetical protein